MYKVDYLHTPASRKAKDAVVQQVLWHLQTDGYRFVQKVDNLWLEAPTSKARAKVVQALREGAPELRKEIEASSTVKTVRSSLVVNITEDNVMAIVTSNAREFREGLGYQASICSLESGTDTKFGEGMLGYEASISSLENDDADSTEEGNDFLFELQPLPLLHANPSDDLDLDGDSVDMLLHVLETEDV